MFPFDLSFQCPMAPRPGALFASALDSDALKRHIEAVEDQDQKPTMTGGNLWGLWFILGGNPFGKSKETLVYLGLVAECDVL